MTSLNWEAIFVSLQVASGSTIPIVQNSVFLVVHRAALTKERLMSVVTPSSMPDAYSETTRGITVSVQPVFLENQSEPDEGQYFWAYHVRIENHSDALAQLLTRHWRIVDARGQAHDVIGDGVVGEQPTLEPGQVFEYTSGTPLTTSSGFMSGSFRMINEAGEMFEVSVPAFSLDSYEGPRPVVH